MYHDAGPAYHGTGAAYHGTDAVYHGTGVVYHGTGAVYHGCCFSVGFEFEMPFGRCNYLTLIDGYLIVFDH